MAEMAEKTRKVAVLAFEQISPFHLSVPCMVFGDAAMAAGVSGFELMVCSEEQAVIRSSAGFRLVTDYGLDALAGADIVIIPSWSSPQQRPSVGILDAINQAHTNGAVLVGLCLGAYVLAAAGLLNHKSATTHWAYAEDLQGRYPDVKMQADVLYHQEGNIITSAGTAAAIDCCLHLMRQFTGTENSNRVARMMVTAPHRTGTQAQFIELPVPEKISDKKLALLLDEILENLSAPYSTDMLANRMAMSRRTFTRHFRALTGYSVGQWILDQRLRYCQNLLEQSDQSIEQIAQRSGFQSVVSLRHHFRQRFGISPGEWRKNFRIK